MSFKNFITLALATIGLSAFAVVESQNTLCRIKVTSTTKDTALALPLVDVGGSTDSINITDMVLTNGLAQGTKLMARVGGEWQTWSLGANGWESVPTTNGDVTQISESNASFARGTAIILSQSKNTDFDPIYLYGQVNNASKEVVLNKGYTLVGNAKPAAVALNSIQFKDPATPANGDEIIVASATGNAVQVIRYRWGTYNGNTGWHKGGITDGKITYTLTEDTIPAGVGFWYNRVADDPITIVW